MNRRVCLRAAGLLLMAGFGWTGCGMHPAGPMQHDSSSIDRDKAELVRVNLNMGGGELRVDSGTDKLATANFDYNVAEWKPEVHYVAGELSIMQPGSTHVNFGGSQKNEWNVRLNGEVPMEFTVHFGAGEGHLNLGGLNLRRLDMEMGAGELEMDLRGTPKNSYDVRIRGGAGEMKIHLPAGVGIDSTVKGGLGEIEAGGLHKDGSRYTNDALGKSPVTVHLDVEGGVGEIHLIP